MDTQKFGPNYIGNVIRIIDSQTLLINVGSKSLDVLLELNDKIQVYELGPEIFDYTGESLGFFEFIKDTLKVTEINDRYAVCKKTETVTKNVAVSSFALSLSPLFGATTTEHVPLKVEEKDIEPIDIIDEYIRVGDPVKLA